LGLGGALGNSGSSSFQSSSGTKEKAMGVPPVGPPW
jgi:hypothetical protein